MKTFDYSICPIGRRIALSSVFIVILVCISTGPLSAQQPPPPINWNAFKFLIGEWVGEGTGAPGEGTGGFSFSYDLQNTVLVRKNFANYPATKDRPAFTHDDLMIVYQEAGKTGQSTSTMSSTSSTTPSSCRKIPMLPYSSVMPAHPLPDSGSPTPSWELTGSRSRLIWHRRANPILLPHISRGRHEERNRVGVSVIDTDRTRVWTVHWR